MEQIEINRLFEYRDGYLFWRVKPRNQKLNGNKAGRPGAKGYIQIGVAGKNHYAHRLIFALHNGYTPKCVDHINGIVDDNRIENLRDATLSQNLYNAKTPKNNKSGIKGVHWSVAAKKWQVQISVNKKAAYFGCYEDLELAELVAIEARTKYHGVYAKHI
jgi:hypothetical protein